MYNRYIPQPDGSYRKNRIPDPSRHQKPEPPPQKPCPSPPKQEQHTPPKSHPPRKEYQDVSGFLRHLLPKDFDSGDLLIAVLLLLMAGDCTEDKNTALLTLILYFFM